MARTAAAAALTAQHRQAQLQIRGRAIRDYARLWPLWRGDSRSFDRLVNAVVPLAAGYHRLSAAVAVDYYGAFRSAEAPGGAATPRVSRGLRTEAFVAGLHVTGRKMTREAIVAGHSPQSAMQSALVRTSGNLTRHVLEGGRETLTQSSQDDPRARGWQRVTSGNACAFCAMTASRGAAYSEEGAGFEAHDGCACSAEPVYGDAAMPPESQRFRDLYNQAVREAKNADELKRGTSNDSLNAFRRLLTQQS